MSEEERISGILRATKRIAVVGWSPDASRPSARITDYLERAGFQVARVNPTAPGAIPSLDAVPGPLDLVVVFRRAAQAMAHVEEAIARGVPAVWLQTGITTPDGARRAAAAGVAYVEDRCVMVEHAARRGG